MSDTSARLSPDAPISVILVSYMTGPALLESVAALNSDPEVTEVIVVDNGNSVDDRRALYAAVKLGGKGRVFQGHGNIGFASACNYGASVATGDYLHFLNPDAITEIGASRRLAEAGSGRQMPWLTGGLLVDEAGAEQVGARRGPLKLLTALSAATPLKRLPGMPSFNRCHEPMPTSPTPMPTISGASFLMDRASFESVGGLDEGYFLHVEDVALCRTVRQAGGTVLFVPSARARHYLSTSNAPAWAVERHKLCGFLRYFWTSGPGLWAKLTTLFLFPLLVAGMAARLLARALRR